MPKKRYCRSHKRGRGLADLASNKLQYDLESLVDETTIASASRNRVLGEGRQLFDYQQETNKPASLFEGIMSRLDKTSATSTFDYPWLGHQEPRLPRLAMVRPKIDARRRVSGNALALIDLVSATLGQTRSFDFFFMEKTWARSGRSLSEAYMMSFGIEYVLDVHHHFIGLELLTIVSLCHIADRHVFWARRIFVADMMTAVSLRELADDIAAQVIGSMNRHEIVGFPANNANDSHRRFLMGQEQIQRLSLPNVLWARYASVLGFVSTPNFASAAALVARSYYLEWITTGENRDILLDEGRRWAVHATQLDPTLPDGFREYGQLAVYQNRYEEGLSALAEAERLAPDDPDNLIVSADSLYITGEHEAAEKKITRAIKSATRTPDFGWWVAACISFHRGQYADAVNLAERMLHIGPANRILAASHAMLGSKRKAALCAEEIQRTCPTFRISAWVPTLPYGKEEDARHFGLGLKEAGCPV